MTIDLYTPWRENPEELAARHVGRAEAVDAIVEGARSFARGDRPLPIYLFGPRGVGKSHLLSLARSRLEAAPLDVRMVPEDIAAHRDASRLIGRIAQIAGDGERVALLFEGLDRQLRALGRDERRSLRRLIEQRPGWFIVATGVTLPAELTGKDEAFYGAFDPWPLEPLESVEAAALLDRIARADDARWPARRATLVTLAGGNARALVALGLACREHPSRWASDQLHAVVRDFTAHYQMRFRDLAPQAQQIVEVLAAAPREMTPSELAERLETTTSQMSVQAGRLVDDGALRQRSEGRQSFYRLAEPLFRYWLEYRTASWGETRAGWLSRLLEALMSPTELADAWWRHPAEEIRRAAMRSGAASRAAWQRVIAAAREGDLDTAVARAAELEPSPALRQLTARVIAAGRGSLLAQLPLGKLPDQRALARFEAALRERTASPKGAFVALLEALSARDAELGVFDREMLLEGVAAALAQHRTGRPWKLERSPRANLAMVPGLRAYFAEHGRLRSHPPLIDPEDILPALGGIVPDAARLMVVGAVRGHDGLVKRAAEGFRAESSFVFPPCPRPMRVLGADAARAVAEAAVRAIEASGGLLRDLVVRLTVSWSASFASLEPERFDRLVELVTASDEVPHDEEGDELALAVLALEDLARFERLTEALGRGWREAAAGARLLAAELGEVEGGRLYPELERLRSAMSEGHDGTP